VCLKSIRAVIAKEWKCFIGSDRGMFVLYMFLVLTWSVLLATRSSANFNAGPLWLVFFSVVITANFSNTIFISERVSGALEILITSGFSRNAVLYGKMLFILAMSLIFGILCITITFLFQKFIYNNELQQIDISGFFLYAGSAFLNVASSAYLSVRMSNPRLLHFANMFLLGTVVGIYMLLSSMFNVHLFFLILFFCAAAVFICWRAQILYNSEKILQPIYM
jgi:ABC-type transport system involved in cytochrome c biogenesis permease component